VTESYTGTCSTPHSAIPVVSLSGNRRKINSMAELHMTEAELARDLPAVLEKVRQGIEVVVERDNRPVAVLRPASPPSRTISECIAIAEKRQKERGFAVTLDPDFAAYLEEIIRSRQPWNPPSWE
jgi:antitoxin (DNA-binding transcriptional repressor) of toxin-antitoxin stability system